MSIGKTPIHLRSKILSCIHISEGNLGDVLVLDVLVLEVGGAIYLMDRSTLDAAWLCV